eukprot:NODE_58_length_25774_cov_0.240545.p6 type:complete len:367 gc:universal NODE_58_length_25774_cov_0.240545:12505-13605(+)
MFTLLFSLVTSTSDDCPDLISFAYGLNMHIKQPAVMASLLVDCCVYAKTKVVCSADTNRVTGFDWYRMSLNGTMNGTAIPSAMTGIYLYQNTLTGSLPVLPSSLVSINIYGNRLNGTIMSPLPVSMQGFSISNNYLVGGLPNPLPPKLQELAVQVNKLSGLVPPLPTSLTILDLGNNKFSGIVEMLKPTTLNVNDNFITNVIIQNFNSLNLLLTSCDISNNPLLEHFNDTNLQRCTKNDLYSINDLPVTISSSLGLATSTSKFTTFNFKSTFIQKPNPQTTVKTSSVYLSSTENVKYVGLLTINPLIRFSKLSVLEWVGIVIKWIIGIVCIRTIISYTPFKREWKNYSSRQHQASTSSGFSISVVR